jgi:hypothetical protein
MAILGGSAACPATCPAVAPSKVEEAKEDLSAAGLAKEDLSAAGLAKAEVIPNEARVSPTA